MTRREFFEAIISNTITEEVIAHAKKEIAKLDSTNARKRDTLSKAQEANLKVLNDIMGLMTDKPQSAAWFGEQLGLSTAKVASLMGKLIISGDVSREEIKVDKRKTSGYRLAKVAEE